MRTVTIDISKFPASVSSPSTVLIETVATLSNNGDSVHVRFYGNGQDDSAPINYAARVHDALFYRSGGTVVESQVAGAVVGEDNNGAVSDIFLAINGDDIELRGAFQAGAYSSGPAAGTFNAKVVVELLG